MTYAEERLPYVPAGWRALAPFERLQRGDMFFNIQYGQWRETTLAGQTELYFHSRIFSYIRNETL